MAKKELSPLLKRLQKSSKLKLTTPLEESMMFNEKAPIPLDIPIMNIALSASLNGGLYSGLCMIAGESKRFKSLFGLIMAKAYLQKFPDSVMLFYDLEFGTPRAYFEMLDIPMERVLHIPVHNIEELKFDLIHQLEKGLEDDDKAFIMIDSIGNVASKKELDDALSENTALDMTRAKQLKSLFRMVTPYLTIKDFPLVAINHIYQSMTLYPTDIVSGGKGSYLSSSTVWIVGRSNEKEGSDLAGYNFNIKVDKSRYVKEGSKFPITVKFDGGVEKYSGLLELAVEAGIIAVPTQGFYQKVDLTTGELIGDRLRKKAIKNAAFWEPILAEPKFNEWIEARFKIGGNGKPLIRTDNNNQIPTYLDNDEDHNHADG